MNYIPISGHHLFSYSLSLNLLAITMPSVQNQALPSFNLILHPTDHYTTVLPNLSFPSWSYAHIPWSGSPAPVLFLVSQTFFSSCFCHRALLLLQKNTWPEMTPTTRANVQVNYTFFFLNPNLTLTVNPFIDFRHCLAWLELWT
jgi:hypothetical protein